MKHFCILNEPMVSLSTCHPGVLPWATILFNLDDFFYGTALFEQLINIARFVEMGACMCV